MSVQPPPGLDAIPPPLNAARYPDGNARQAAWAEPPSQPRQKCALPGAPLAHAWEREVQCYSGDGEVLPSDACAAAAAVPAFARETGERLGEFQDIPTAQYAYTIEERCPLVWDVMPWDLPTRPNRPPPAYNIFASS